MDRSATILIAGGGIGGLTAALALADRGIRSRILERAPTPQTAGAGIQITPNAGRILARLGLEPAIKARASEPDLMEIRSWHGQRIINVPFGKRFAKRYGIPYRTIHRADLLEALVEAVSANPNTELLLGHSVVEFAIHPKGLTILAEHEGTHVEFAADGLIGADGIGSFIRGVMPNARPRKPTHRSAWRAVIKAADAPEGMPEDAIGLWLGPNGHVVHYPVRGGADVRKRLKRWADPVQSLLAVEADWQRWPIATVHPSGPWASGPVALLGDAAHAMAPYLAQGGAMAIEDAAVLARAHAADPNDVPAAFRRYVAARRFRVGRVWRAARSAADLYHMGAVTGGLRNLVMRILGGSGIAWRYRWIYRWQPPDEKARRPKAARSPAQGEPAS